MQTQLVYQCKNCKTILSDSLHGEGVTLPKDESSQAIYVKQANVEQPEDGRPQINEETFSVSMALVCVSCKSHVGHRLISTSSDLDHLRGFLSLDGSVETYQLGQQACCQALDMHTSNAATAGISISQPGPIGEGDDDLKDADADFIVFKHGASWQAADYEIAMLKSYCCVLHEAVSDLREQVLAIQANNGNGQSCVQPIKADAQQQTETLPVTPLGSDDSGLAGSGKNSKNAHKALHAACREISAPDSSATKAPKRDASCLA